MSAFFDEKRGDLEENRRFSSI